MPREKSSLGQDALHVKSMAPCYVDSLACCWCSSAANQAQSFPNVDPSIIRTNDSLACCRSDQVMKTPSKGTFRILGIRPDGNESNSCTFPESPEQLILEQSCRLKSRCYLLTSDDSS